MSMSSSTLIRRLAPVIGLVLVVAVGLVRWRGAPPPAIAVDEATVDRGPLVVRLTEVGTLRAAESVTYRSPLEGREAEIAFLAPEGLRVGEGDLIARLDASGVLGDLARAEQQLRQAMLDVRIAEGERGDAQAAVSLVGEDGDSLDVEEARLAAALAARRLERARREYADLEPLLAPGHITRDELERADIEREQAEATSRLAARRLETLERLVQPRDAQRARIQLSQAEARLEHARQRVEDATRQVEALGAAVDACAIYARRGGLVVYEDHVGDTPRRKVRVGDRVTPSQGLLTIPEVARMLVHASIREADVHRVQVGAPARIRVDAFPALDLEGRVLSVGTLARASIERPTDDKRFDLVIDVLSAPESLRPEMTARVDVQVSARDAVLRVPINAVFERDDGPRVHVVTPRGLETRRVDLGQANALYYEVVDGLAAGDRVRLIDVVPSERAPAPLAIAGGSP